MIAGHGFLALAMCGSLLLVATKLFGVFTGVVTVSLAAIPFLVIWFALPLRRKARLNAARYRSENGSGEQLGASGGVRFRRVP
jgi:hypothetical protein